MFRFKPSHVIFLLLGLALTGFGCKTPQAAVFKPGDRLPSWLQQNLSNPVAEPASTNTASTTTDNSQPDNHPVVDHTPDPRAVYLRQVLRNLQLVDTFRASMNLPIETTAVQVDMDYVRVKGFHGTMTVPSVSSTEIYVLGDKVYARASTNAWLNLSYSPEGDQAQKVYNSVLQFKKDANGYEFISDRAKVLSESTDPSGCKNYLLHQFDPYQEAEQTVKICVKNDLPTMISLLTTDGLIEIHYRDFNQWIDMVPPVME